MSKGTPSEKLHGKYQNTSNRTLAPCGSNVNEPEVKKGRFPAAKGGVRGKPSNKVVTKLKTK